MKSPSEHARQGDEGVVRRSGWRGAIIVGSRNAIVLRLSSACPTSSVHPLKKVGCPSCPHRRHDRRNERHWRGSALHEPTTLIVYILYALSLSHLAQPKCWARTEMNKNGVGINSLLNKQNSGLPAKLSPSRNACTTIYDSDNCSMQRISPAPFRFIILC